MRRLHLKVKPKLVGIMKKIDRREKVREAKALKAANISSSIKEELLARLQQGTYGDIYNFPQQEYEDVLEDDFEYEMDEDEDDGVMEFVEEYDEDIMSDEEEAIENTSIDYGVDDEAILQNHHQKSSTPSGPRVEIEYEHEFPVAVQQEELE